MVLERPGGPLRLVELKSPVPRVGQVLIAVRACAVCRTDLHIVDGELSSPKLPLVPGHEIVGVVKGLGEGVRQWHVGDRIGVPWLGWTCGECGYCTTGHENLCERARFTGYTLDGGFAQLAAVDQRYCFAISGALPDAEAAPLLCAGLIGYRALRKAGAARRLGIYGFGAAAHIITQVARYEQREVYAFTKPGDRKGQEFARSLGAVWTGGSDTQPPELLDAAIIFAPVGALVPAALKTLVKGGVLVCGGIHMSDIPSFPYELLWGERSICSVANLTRRDAEEFLPLAVRAGVRTTTQTYALEQANQALEDLREGRVVGAAVLVP